jgi:class 3 adenylate cyclase
MGEGRPQLGVGIEIERGIRTTLDAVCTHFIAGETEAWLQLVVDADDIAWIATGPEEYAVGKRQLMTMVAESLVGTANRRAHYELRTISSEGTVAWASGMMTISAVAAGRNIDLPFRFTGVFVERGGRWLIAQFHQSVGDARQQGATWDTLLDAVATEVQREQPPLARHAAPDGSVSLVFTDIEGSTAMNARVGDLAWIELLRDHNAIVRERLDAHGGSEVKTIGDAFMLAFPSARRALLCCIDMQRAFAAYGDEWPDRALSVRMGVHAGEPVREGSDFFGTSVALASRIASQARGGEVLASTLVRELAQSAGDIAFGAPTHVAINGFDGTQALHPVLWRHGA